MKLDSLRSYTEKNSDDRLSLLFAPANEFLDQEAGSESESVISILTALSKRVFSIDAIFGSKSGAKVFKDNVCVHTVFKNGRKRFSIFGVFVFTIRYFLTARKLLRKKNFQIIHHCRHFTYDRSFNLLVIFRYTARKKFVIGPLQVRHVNREKYESRENFFEKVVLTVFSPILQFLSRCTLKRADMIIVSNQDCLDAYKKIVPANKIAIVPMGLDLERFQYQFQEHPHVMKIISVGYISKRKNLPMLLYAYKEIDQVFQNKIQLSIVGDGDEFQNMKKLASDLSIRSIRFLGKVNHQDIPKIYTASDILVSTSYSEAFGPWNVLEAMASGCAVIATKNPATRSSIKDYQTGIFINIDDIKGLVDVLKILIEDENLRKRLAFNARKEIEKTYDIEKIADRYFWTYEKLLRR